TEKNVYLFNSPKKYRTKKSENQYIFSGVIPFLCNEVIRNSELLNPLLKLPLSLVILKLILRQRQQQLIKARYQPNADAVSLALKIVAKTVPIMLDSDKLSEEAYE
ncbi:hypothetical protein, partial [uncultured Psychrobacter sp.]|uniref:hypothetical protein n=1 Tax=uncultured Psychrobacter sp. TaxID=259303 RepID=UPI00260B3434